MAYARPTPKAEGPERCLESEGITSKLRECGV